MKRLCIDFEGTSKEPRRGCPVQIGVAVMEDGIVIDSDEWLIKPPLHFKTGLPTREVDAYSLRISGLSLEQIEADGLASGPSCSRLSDFVRRTDSGCTPVVAYNFTYDAECYGQMLFDGGFYEVYKRQYMPFEEILSPNWCCAYRMSRKHLPLDGFKLDDVAGHFGLSRTTDKHGALEDAILAGRIYFALMEGRR